MDISSSESQEAKVSDIGPRMETETVSSSGSERDAAEETPEVARAKSRATLARCVSRASLRASFPAGKLQEFRGHHGEETIHYNEIDSLLRQMEEEGETGSMSAAQSRKRKSWTPTEFQDGNQSVGSMRSTGSAQSLVGMQKLTSLTMRKTQSSSRLGATSVDIAEYREPDSSELPKNLEDAIKMIKELDFEHYQATQNMMYSAAVGRELIEKLNSRNKDNADLYALCSTLEQDKEVLTESVKQLEKERATLVKELNSARQTIRSYQTSLTYLEEEGKENQTKAENLEAQLSEKTEEIKTRNHHKDLVWATEKMKMDLRVGKKEKEVVSLQERLSEAEEELKKKERDHADQVERLQEEIAQHEMNLQRLTKDLETAETHAEELKQKHERQIEFEVSQHAADIESRETIMKTLKTAHSELDTKLKSTQDKLATTEGVVKSLKSELCNSQETLEAEAKKYTHQIKQLKADIEAYGISLQKEKDARRVETASWNKRLEEKEAAVQEVGEELKAVVQENEQQLEALQRKVVEKEEEKGELRRQLEEEAGKRLQARLEEAQKGRDEVQRKLSECNAKLQAAQQVESNLNDDLMAKRQEISEMQTEAVKQKDEVSRLRGELRNHAEAAVRSAEAAKAALEQKHKELQRIEANLSSSQAEAGRLQADLAKRRIDFDDVRHEMQVKITTLQGSLDDKERQLSRLTHEHNLQLQALQKATESKTALLEKQDANRQTLEVALRKGEVEEARLKQQLGDLEVVNKKLTAEVTKKSAELQRATEKQREMEESSRLCHHGEKEKLLSQMEDLRKALAEEVKHHQETQEKHSQAADKWKEAAEEARKAGNTRVMELKSDYQARLETLHRQLGDCKSDLDGQTQRAQALKKELDTFHTERRAWEAKLEQRASQIREEEIKHLTQHLSAKSADGVNRLIMEKEILQKDLQQEQQRVATANRKLLDASERHKVELKQVRNEHSERMQQAAADHVTAKAAIQQLVVQQAGKIKAESERYASLEAKLHEMSSAFKLREDELRKQISRATDSMEEQVQWSSKQIQAEKENHIKLDALLTRTRAELEATRSTAAAKEEEQRKEIAASEEQNRELAAELAHVQSRTEMLEIKTAELQAAVDAATDRSTRLEDKYTQRVEDLMHKVQFSREREVKLELEVEQLTKQLEDVTLHFERAKQTLAEVSAQLEESKAAERDSARRTLLAESTALKCGDEVRDLSAQLQEAQSMLADTQQGLEAAHSLHVSQLDEQRRADEEQRHQARMLDMSMSDDGFEQLMKDETARMEKRYGDLLHSMRQKDKECTALREKLEQTERGHNEADRLLQVELRELRATADGYEETISELRAERAAADTAVQAATADLDANLNMQLQLHKEVEAAQLARDASENKARSLSCRIAELEVQLKSNEEQFAAKQRKLLEDHQAEMYGCQKRVADAAERETELQTSLKTTREALDRALNASRVEQGKTFENTEALVAQIYQLRREVEERDAAAEVSKGRATQSSAELKALKRALEQHLEVNTRLRHELNSVEVRRQTAEENQENLRREAEEAQRRAVEDTQRAVERVEAESGRARRAEEEAVELDNAVRQMKADLKDLRAELQEQKVLRERLSGETTGSSREKERLAEELAAVKARQVQLLEDVERARRDCDEQRGRGDALERKLAADRERVEESEQRCVRLREEMITHVAGIEKLEVERRSLADALEAADHREVTLRAQLRRATENQAEEIAARVARAEAQQTALAQASAAEDTITRHRHELHYRAGSLSALHSQY